MFPRERRLRTTTDIITTLRRGVRSSQGPISCSLLKKGGTLSRVTVIVDTKVSKKATDRNLLKRRIRAILQSTSMPSGDMVMRAYPAARELSFAALNQQVQKCLSKFSPSRSV